MSEFVLIIPLIVVILALLFYMGRLVVRAQHMSVMTRYETWRQVVRGPGPASDDLQNHAQLNNAFYGGRATAIGHPIGDDEFPNEPYTQMLAVVNTAGADAGAWADRWIYRPGGEHRLNRGRRNAFTVYHADASAMWSRITSIAHRPIDNPEESTPLIRRHTVIGHDWPYTNDYRASYDTWTGTIDVDMGLNHLRSVRDAFFLDFDASLDAVDGATMLEYSDQPGGSQVPANDTVAGMIRNLYLRAPAYRGPDYNLRGKYPG